MNGKKSVRGTRRAKMRVRLVRAAAMTAAAAVLAGMLLAAGQDIRAIAAEVSAADIITAAPPEVTPTDGQAPDGDGDGAAASGTVSADLPEVVPSGTDTAAPTVTVSPTDAEEPPVSPTDVDKPSVNIVRLGGDNRFETAALIAGYDRRSADTVFIVNAFSYADALAGTPLAFAYNAPILLTGADSLNPVTESAIEKLGARRVFILGGKAAVGEAVEKKLKQNGCEVERIWGETRYSTAVAIEEALRKESGASGEVFIASGENYPDALSASAAAAVKGCPILYSPASGKPDSATTNCVKKAGFHSAYILGGSAAIGTSAEQALSKAGVKITERLGGSDRYETSLLIAKRFSQVLESGDTAFATGKNFPDALAGSVLAAKLRLAVILTDNTSAREDAQNYIAGKETVSFYVFGSTGVVSDAVLEEYTKGRNIDKPKPVEINISEAVYLGVKDYNGPTAMRSNMATLDYRFRVGNEEMLFKMYNGTPDSAGRYDYPLQNIMKVGNRYTLRVRDGRVVEAADITEPLQYDPPVSGEAGKHTLGNFLRIAMEPVGTTLYIYGGGWDWDGTASSVQSKTVGVSSDWVRFFRSQDAGFTYRDKDGDSSKKDAKTSYYPYGGINQYYYAGLDCSGYAAWTVYNTLNSESGGNGYVLSATKMASQFAAYGLGEYSKPLTADGKPDGKYLPGDIYSISGHIWISLGTCSDGSVVILHSTPSNSRKNQPGGGVQIGAIGASANCEAYKLADRYMSKYYPEWYKRYPVSLKSAKLYLDFSKENTGRFRWSGDVLSDPEGFSGMSAAQTLAALFGA